MFRRFPTDAEKEAFAVPFSAEALRELCQMVEGGKLKMNLAKATLEQMLDTGKPASAFLSESDLAGLDEGALREVDVYKRQTPSCVAVYSSVFSTVMPSITGFSISVASPSELVTIWE